MHEGNMLEPAPPAVRWISDKDGDGYGYDILSFTPMGEERLLEVKTTCGHDRTPFWITRRECEVAAQIREFFRIRRASTSATIRACSNSRRRWKVTSR
jgi:hypothetical protein